MRILVVEDESRIADFLSRGLVSAGYAVDVAATGGSAIDMIHSTDYDLVILDLGLPDVDGLTVLQKIRNRKVSPPVLILSARDAVDDRVKGLEGGADDYLVKPFASEELIARLRALLRRTGWEGNEETMRFEDLELDPVAHEARRNGRPLELTRTEFLLLELLMRHPRQVLSRTKIFECVWGYDFGPASNSLEVYVGYLRRKTEAGGEPRVVHTVRGVGYVLRSS